MLVSFSQRPKIPQGSTKFDSSIGKPISPEVTIPLNFFATVMFNIFFSTVLDIPVVYEFIKKNNGLSESICSHNSTKS